MPDWVLPTVIVGFATVLWCLIRWIIDKQEKMETALSDKQARTEERLTVKLVTIEGYIQHELRAMDVRLSVVETLVLAGTKAGGRRLADGKSD